MDGRDPSIPRTFFLKFIATPNIRYVQQRLSMTMSPSSLAKVKDAGSDPVGLKLAWCWQFGSLGPHCCCNCFANRRCCNFYKRLSRRLKPSPVALGNIFELLLLLLCVMSISRQPSPLPHFFNSFVSLVSFSLVL